MLLVLVSHMAVHGNVSWHLQLLLLRLGKMLKDVLAVVLVSLWTTMYMGSLDKSVLHLSIVQ